MFNKIWIIYHEHTYYFWSVDTIHISRKSDKSQDDCNIGTITQWLSISSFYENSLYRRFRFYRRNSSDLELQAYLALEIFHSRTPCNSIHTDDDIPDILPLKSICMSFIILIEYIVKTLYRREKTSSIFLHSCYLSLMYSFGMRLITSTVYGIISWRPKTESSRLPTVQTFFEELGYEYISFLFERAKLNNIII